MQQPDINDRYQGVLLYTENVLCLVLASKLSMSPRFSLFLTLKRYELYIDLALGSHRGEGRKWRVHRKHAAATTNNDASGDDEEEEEE
ncbi:unnamed protein product [Rhizoctonia solani]|uniref:Uncharacterized protein n=1 Tax=Rhizoctonia solani TaxID=456999 RepID=A0A8H3C6X2_9AGAM|nr:unnamed protein product [Rhizoctonia solani]